MRGTICLSAMRRFTPAARSTMFEYGVTSEPVPAVVGTAMTRLNSFPGNFSVILPEPNSSETSIPVWYAAQAAFAASITLPPPMATTSEHLLWFSASMMRATSSVSGSAGMSHTRRDSNS